VLSAATELPALYKTPQKRNPSMSDQAIWEAISQDLGTIYFIDEKVPLPGVQNGQNAELAQKSCHFF